MTKIASTISILLLLIIIGALLGCNRSSTQADFEYPYTKTIDFIPTIYEMEGKLIINGNQAHVDFDIPEITSEVVSKGDVTVRLYDNSRWYDVPVEVRYTYEGTPYWKGYVDYSYYEGGLRIINGTTSQDTMLASYFKGGPYEVTVTK